MRPFPRVHHRVFVLLVATFGLPALGAIAGPIVVAEFGFEDGSGQADPQGWRALHVFQNEEAYFHVDDFSGAGHITGPLAGSQSMWCGLAVEDPRTCHWGVPPGYGVLWRQNLCSIEFAVKGDVSLDFLMEVGVEPGYDFVHVQYEDPLGVWQTLDSYNCGSLSCEPQSQSYVVPAASHDGTIRFRFFLTSDGAGDNETIPFGMQDPLGFVVDDLTVSDDMGVVDSQDFENEALGAQITSDGSWFAETNEDGLYHGGFLVSGAGVLQESPATNDSPVWAFFDGSARDYSCAGHPEQLVVDETWSIIRSARIDVTRDVEGHEILGAPDSLLVEFDVYRDITPGESKTYRWFFSDYSEDCLLRRRATHGSAQGDQKDWYRHQVVWAPQPGTANIVLELGVNNADFSPTDCRSHAPLFDNVTVTRFGGTVTAVNDQPAARKLTLRPNKPNPFNPGTAIEFAVPEDTRQLSLRVYDAAGHLVRTLLEGSLPAGLRSAYWDGCDDTGRGVASGVYYYELDTGKERASRRMLLLK